MVNWVYEDVLWLDVAMAHSDALHVGQRSEHLIGVDLYELVGVELLGLAIESNHFAEGFWDVVHHQVQIEVVLFKALIRFRPS